MDNNITSAVLILGLPQGAFAGIDLLSFTTTPRFHGIKHLPPGLHFVFTGSSTNFSERHGLWFHVKKGAPAPQLFICKWNSTSETLIPELDEAEVLRWRANLGGVWREGLTPYRQSTGNGTNGDAAEDVIVDWPQITSHITDRLLSRITGSDSTHCSVSSSSTAKRDLDDIPGLVAEDFQLPEERELDFLPINLKQTWRDGATGRERTEAAQDRSWALDAMIASHSANQGTTQIIGEMQFCFLMVLTINNFSCLEQWKRILTLLFTCKMAVVKHSTLFVQAIKTLQLQLQHCKVADGGLIDLADEGGSLLKTLLVRFRKGLDGLGGLGMQAVVDELDDLEEHLHREQGWTFGGSFAKSGVLELEDGEQVPMDTSAFDEDDETGEYAPQIVNLTPEQARLLNVGGADELHHSLGKASLHEVISSDEDSGDERLAVTSGQRHHDVVHRKGIEDDDEEDAQDLEDMDARF